VAAETMRDRGKESDLESEGEEERGRGAGPGLEGQWPHVGGGGVPGGIRTLPIKHLPRGRC
jgi:hypothetical protein